MSDIEKAEGVLSIYTSAGYQAEDVVRLIKYLENNGYQPGKTDRSLILGKVSLTKSNLQTKTELMINEKFLDIVESIGYSPNTQYKYLQIAVKLEPSILKEAEEKGLSMNKKIMLTNTKLRDIPQLQKYLIDKIANQSETMARTIITETINELEAGIIVKDKNAHQQLKDKIISQKSKNGYPTKLVKTHLAKDGITELSEFRGNLIIENEIVPCVITVDFKTKKFNSLEVDNDEYRKLNMIYIYN